MCSDAIIWHIEACVLNKQQIASLVNQFFMKLFKTYNIETVKACQEFFVGFQLPSVQLCKHMKKFEDKFNGSTSRPTKS